MKIDQIVKKAEAFEKLAAVDFAGICKSYGAAIQRELAGGIAAINKLVTTNRQAAESHGIEVLDEMFGKIGDVARQLEPSGIDLSIRDLRSLIGNASFYTNSFNAGTGFDPATRIGGATSPGAYLQRIKTLVDNLEKWSKQIKPEAPAVNTRHDPSLPSV